MSKSKYKDPGKGMYAWEGGSSLEHLHSHHQIAQDCMFVAKLLPTHYTVEESHKASSIHCVSKKGIKLSGTVDTEDAKYWDEIFSSIKNHFGDRFQEVYHNVCFLHKDFTIYLKDKPHDAIERKD